MGLNYDSIFITCPTCTGRFCWLAWWGHWTCLSERLTMVAYRDGWSNPQGDLGDLLLEDEVKHVQQCWWNDLKIWICIFGEKNKFQAFAILVYPRPISVKHTPRSVVNGYVERFTYNHQMKVWQIWISTIQTIRHTIDGSENPVDPTNVLDGAKKTFVNNGRFQLPTFPSTAEWSPDFWLPPTSYVAPKPTVFGPGLGSKHHQVLEGLPEANSDPLQQMMVTLAKGFVKFERFLRKMKLP